MCGVVTDEVIEEICHAFSQLKNLERLLFAKSNQTRIQCLVIFGMNCQYFFSFNKSGKSVN